MAPCRVRLLPEALKPSKKAEAQGAKYNGLRGRNTRRPFITIISLSAHTRSPSLTLPPLIHPEVLACRFIWCLYRSFCFPTFLFFPFGVLLMCEASCVPFGGASASLVCPFSVPGSLWQGCRLLRLWPRGLASDAAAAAAAAAPSLSAALARCPLYAEASCRDARQGSEAQSRLAYYAPLILSLCASCGERVRG